MIVHGLKFAPLGLKIALFGLVVAGSPVFAATQDDRASVQRMTTARNVQVQARSPSRAAASSIRTVDGGQRNAVRLHAFHQVPRAGGQRASARDWRSESAGNPFGANSCVLSRGVTRCRGQSLSWSQGGSIGGWTRGLAPAANVQANECPAGTMATLARGHDDVVRCMPI